MFEITSDKVSSLTATSRYFNEKKKKTSFLVELKYGWWCTLRGDKCSAVVCC